MVRKTWFQSVRFVSVVALLVSGPALAASPVESPLEELIPARAKQRIDRRKSAAVYSPRGALESFAGSREVDLRHRDTPVKHQFSAKKCAGFHNKVGTCSAFGLVAAVENALGGGVHLSEREFWSQYCVPSSASAMSALSSGRGMVEEAFWPEDFLRPQQDLAKAGRFKALKSRALEDDVPSMLAALDAGSPLYFAINTPSQMLAGETVIDADSGRTGGGHAVAIVGYRLDDSVEGGGYLLLKNSWGTTKGDQGYQWLSIGYCQRKGNYCLAWAIDGVSGR